MWQRSCAISARSCAGVRRSTMPSGSSSRGRRMPTTPGSGIEGEDMTAQIGRAVSARRVAPAVARRSADRIGSHCRHHETSTTAAPTHQTASSSHGHTGDDCGTDAGTAATTRGRRQDVLHHERDRRLHRGRRGTPLELFAEAHQHRERHQELDRGRHPQPAAHPRARCCAAPAPPAIRRSQTASIARDDSAVPDGSHGIIATHLSSGASSARPRLP